MKFMPWPEKKPRKKRTKEKEPRFRRTDDEIQKGLTKEQALEERKGRESIY